MRFTEGQILEYERMMQEKPGHDHKPVKTMKERDCEHCLYIDECCHKCNKEKCTLFDD